MCVSRTATPSALLSFLWMKYCRVSRHYNGFVLEWQASFAGPDGACHTAHPCAIMYGNKTVPLSRTKEVFLYDAALCPAYAGFHRRQPQLLPRYRQHRRRADGGGLCAPVRAGALDAEARREVFRHPQQLQPHRLPRAGDPHRRVHDGRRPQRLPPPSSSRSTQSCGATATFV